MTQPMKPTPKPIAYRNTAGAERTINAPSKAMGSPKPRKKVPKLDKIALQLGIPKP